MTDYPDQALVDNMKYNAAQNGVEAQVAVRGYVWGRPVGPLLEPTGARKFDLILLSDLIFHHAEVRWGGPTLLVTEATLTDMRFFGFLSIARCSGRASMQSRRTDVC